MKKEYPMFKDDKLFYHPQKYVFKTHDGYYLRLNGVYAGTTIDANESHIRLYTIYQRLDCV